MLTEELDFQVPAELIAQEPVEPRDACRLLVLTPPDQVEHAIFRDLPHFLREDDILVVNDSKVMRARVMATKPTGGRVELLFLRPWEADGSDSDLWEVIARPSRRLRPGLVIHVGEAAVEIMEKTGPGQWVVRRTDGGSVLSMLDCFGQMPLPPYVRRRLRQEDDYQTVYARVPGSAAAPTAGLHFTESLLAEIRAKGCEILSVTLHVGLDTFRPITESRVENHRIHEEHFTISADTCARIEEALKAGRRIIAVGTTVVRVLETVFSQEGKTARTLRSGSRCSCQHGTIHGTTSLFITPGYVFRVVGGLITNFHLPRTSLLALVMAFAGKESILSAYTLAIQESYRFFSFGDAMFITRRASQVITPEGIS